MRRNYFKITRADFFSPKGRIDRMTFFIFYAALTIVDYVLNAGMTLGVILLAEAGLSESVVSLAALIMALLITAPVLYIAYCLGSKRLHDFGWSGVWALILVIGGVSGVYSGLTEDTPSVGVQIFSFIALATWAALVLIPGHNRPNKYGTRFIDDPLPKPRILEE